MEITANDIDSEEILQDKADEGQEQRPGNYPVARKNERDRKGSHGNRRSAGERLGSLS